MHLLGEPVYLIGYVLHNLDEWDCQAIPEISSWRNWASQWRPESLIVTLRMLLLQMALSPPQTSKAIEK
jgi:hypothetical protein